MYIKIIMIILWTIVIIIILLLAAGAIFLSLQVKKIKHLEYRLREAFWRRRNKIPLLIETARKAGIKGVPTDEFLELSGRHGKQDCKAGLWLGGVCGKAEDKLFGLLSDIFREAEQDIALIALKKEFQADQENIKIALNNYHFAREELIGYFHQPWFKIFRFAFKMPQI